MGLRLVFVSLSLLMLVSLCLLSRIFEEASLLSLSLS